jgi:serine/threonine protein kinase
MTDEPRDEVTSNPGTRIGTEIAGYRIESVIGRGGMSVIYLATQIRLGRRVALKLLSAELAEDERFRDRFVRESHLASEINHPNIIPIFDAGEDGPYLYIAMRYVDGPSLRELLRRQGPLSVGRLIYIVEQIASALDVAHAAGLVHRDVKPANILLEEASDHAFLTDFGVAKRTTARGLTQTGLIVGTFEYLAPEQIEALPVDARTDVYGLGCLVFECLTGSLPFDRESEVAIMHAHLAAAPPNVTQHRPDLPMALNDVIAKALAKAPDDRFQSCGELATALRAAALRTSTRAVDVPPEAAVTYPPAAEPVLVPELAPASAVAAPPTPPADANGSPGRPRWRGPALVGACVVAAAVLGAGGYALATRGDSKAAASTTTTGKMTETTTMETSTASTSTAMEMTTTAPTTTGMKMETVDTTRSAPERLSMFVADHPWTCDTMSPKYGALATQMCKTQVPQQLSISVFSSRMKLDMAYGAARRALGSPKADSGDCSAVSWAGEGKWFHGENELGGRKFCLLKSSGLSRIVWTSVLGTPTLYEADYQNFNHRDLYFWWKNTRHELF